MKRKILFGFLLISLQSFMVGGGTMAYFTSNATLASTAFNFSTVDIEIAKDNTPCRGGGDQSQVAVWTISNTGGQDVKLRVKVTSNINPKTLEIEETEELTADAYIMKKPKDLPLSEPLTVELVPGANWHFENGYYYYDGILPMGDSVPFSLTLTQSEGDPGKYTYNLDIEAQALQTVNEPQWTDVSF